MNLLTPANIFTAKCRADSFFFFRTLLYLTDNLNATLIYLNFKNYKISFCKAAKGKKFWFPMDI
ncbi:MAG TPA: hypothetical protein DEP27_05680 [Ruminococcaceae bacterium]|nr:hypothetical protein [Oscillospiraceae bacterium]